jgi:transposase-like protein
MQDAGCKIQEAVPSYDRLTPERGDWKVSQRVMRYSEAFKQQVVDELEAGRFGSPYEASQAYGVDQGSVKRWARQYGKAHLLRKVVRVAKPNEPGEIKRLKDRVRRLEAALADSHMDQALDQAFFEILCERTGTDANAFKKKHVGQASTGRGKRPKDGEE